MVTDKRGEGKMNRKTETHVLWNPSSRGSMIAAGTQNNNDITIT